MAQSWSNLNSNPVTVDLSFMDKVGAAGASFINSVGTGNLANAMVTGVLGLIGMIGTVSAGSKVQRLYKKQESAYIDAAMEQARRLQLKGDIELRNLRYQHTIQQGNDELAVAAGAHGNLSGSFLDKLMANKKISEADERSQSLSTLWAVSDAKKAGYINAMKVAGQAELSAINTRAHVLSVGLNSIARAANSLTQDVTARKQMDAKLELIKAQNEANKKFIDYLYTPGKFNNIGAYTSASLISAGISYDDVQEDNGKLGGALYVPPNPNEIQNNELQLPYIQIREDGSLITF